jgi:WD40 repeat protein
MRTLLTFALFLAVPTIAPAFQDEKKELPKNQQPIKVIKLDRKEPVTYEKDIEPIIINKCQYCHSGNLKEGKLDLGSYEGMMRGGKRGAAIVPGKSAESRLVHLSGKTEKPLMPPKNDEPLTPEELALVKLWIDQGAKAPTGERVKVKVVVTPPPAPVHPVRGLAISPDKSMIAASRSNEIHIYDAGSGTYIRSLVDPNLRTADQKPIKAAHLSLVESLAISPDGKYIASGGYQEVIIWDVQTGLLRHRISLDGDKPVFAERVVALAFSPDAKLLATGGGAPTEDGEIKVFDVATGKQMLDIKSGHSDTVFGVSFSPDGKMLATCGADKFVKTWEIPGGKFIKSFEGHTHHVMDVGWKFDGKMLASAGADNVVKIWNFETGEQVRTIAAAGKQVTRLVFLGKTGQFATCAGDAQVRMWNIDNGGNTRNFQGGNDFLYAIAVSPDGAVLAAGGEEGVVRLYNGANGNLIKALLPPGVEMPKK